MKRIPSRFWASLFAALGLITLMLLAISVSRLNFEPGVTFPLSRLMPNLVESAATGQISQSLISAVRLTAIISWVLLPICLVYLVLSKKARMRVLRDLALILPVCFMIYMVIKVMMDNPVTDSLSKGLARADQAGTAALPIPQFVPPPPWVTSAAMTLIAVLFALLVAWVMLFFWRREQRRAQDALAIVRYEVQYALDAIEAGHDIRNAIMTCYYRMIAVLQEKRKISRDRDMTPHEFEAYLEQHGLPHEPVHHLTRLFEMVRYGAIMPGPQEEREAVESLSAIVSACEKAEEDEEAR